MSLTYTYRNIEYLPPITFGFKIHVSATFQNYEYVLEIVKPYLEEKKIAYKFINNREDVYKAFSVHELAGECGKLITIYPSSLILMDTLEDLYQLLKNLDGIYILSDRPYKDSSLVFYRFGLFQDSKDIFQNGVPTVVSLDGEEWQDYPKTYFDLPSWVADIQPAQEENKESYLGDTYEVISVLHQSGGGNIYLAQDKKFGVPTVLKEARPNILSFYDIEKKELREKEYELALELQSRGVERLITPIEKVDEWINTYYIYHYVQGESLTDFCKKYGINSYSREHKQKNLNLFREFIGLINLLVNTLSYFHRAGLVLNDIHPDNFVVGTDGQLHFIDLENSYLYGDKSFTGITSKISLKRWNFLDGKQADYHKLGNMLLFLLARLSISEESQVEPSILDKMLKSYGIESNLLDFITYLLSEEVDLTGITTRLDSLYAKSISTNEAMPTLSQPSKKDTSFVQRVEYMCSSFEKYKVYVSDGKNLSVRSEDRIMRLMNSEQNLGINGLSGVVILLHSKGYHTLALYGLEMVLNRLEETEDGLQVQIEGGFYSPYVFNGLSGVIQMLYYVDKEKYRGLILELRKSLYSEFSQYEDYAKGSLGVADTLLLTANYRKNKRLERCVKSLILNSFIYHQERKKPLDELSYVLSHYHKVYSC
ncbi:hypothetical protein JY232_03735 [Streptococcus thermophilus]|uniref:class III lanthionine synthetase LanKC N-terminal domain-containing protein n=1 Tax=Streptococcus thermophilus TaxID=1308 RepID=UPI0019CFE458|nr:hypothetical protein [Streptococcus thermophilus]MBN6047420.1 hypothetical protein [Streptococcus thermophilus]